jgi:glycosyltransferase involved in cell wall biosynthesis
MTKIIDLATTMQGASRLLRTRVKKINESGEFINYIVCPEDKENIVTASDHDVIPITVQRKIGILQTIREILSVRRVFKREKPHIIHTHNSKAGAIGRITAFFINLVQKEKIIVIHQVHGYYFNVLKGIKKIIFILIEYALAFISDILLFQNRYEYKQSRRLGMHRFTRLLYLGNGIDFTEFLPVRHNTKKPSEPFHFICIARVEPVKNHIMLIKALEYLATSLHFTDFICYCIGEITDSSIVASAQSTRAASFIRFTGPLSRREIKHYLEKAQLSFLTSFKEGMPRSIMESMLFGIPCLVTDVIGTNELVMDGVNGYRVKINDYKFFAQKIKYLCDNPLEWEKLSDNCRHHALEHFNEDNIVVKLQAMYRESMNMKHDRKGNKRFSR